MNFIAPNIKAIAALLAGLIVAPLAFFGVTPDTPFEAGITLILIGLGNFAVVWFSPKNKE